jgi:hypothetical protein
MCDTPETDAEEEASHNFAELVVPSGLARRLERERNEAIRQRNETNESSKYAVDYAIRERDEARHEIEGWRNKWECAIEMAARAENERDEARNRMADALQELDLRTLDFERMRAERDEARNEIEGWRNKWECAVTMAAVAEDEIIKKLEEILNKQ